MSAQDKKARPRYIAVEGPIGVGKTTLAKRLARSFNYTPLLESAEDNPFLERFYQDPRMHALPTQLYFLFERSAQIQKLRQSDLFNTTWVSDFLMEKDSLFAELLLNKDELSLYQTAYKMQTQDIPKPDLVIYLQAPSKTLLQRLHDRGISHDKRIRDQYLRQVNEAYTSFFHYYDDSPLLIINAGDIDFVHNENDYLELLDQVVQIKAGRHYFNPKS